MPDRFRAMQDTYGMNEARHCRDCCNCHPIPGEKNDLYCIAYGWAPQCNCKWDASAYACGLFNRPFFGLTPERKPLVELFSPKQKNTDDVDSQTSFF